MLARTLPDDVSPNAVTDLTADHGFVHVVFSSDVRRVDDVTVQVDLSGELGDGAAQQLSRTLADVIAGDGLDRLVIDVARVTVLSEAAIVALLSGYIAALNVLHNWLNDHIHWLRRW